MFILKPTRKHFYSTISLFFFLVFCINDCYTQTITDSLLHKITDRFVTQQNYKLETIVESVNNLKDGLPPDAEINCTSGKEMLAVAVFVDKPKNLFARMLVTKHYNKKTAYDEHLFQDAAFEESFKVYYSLVRVQFPAEANKLNCGVNLQVYDKSNPAKKVWLLVFSK